MIVIVMVLSSVGSVYAPIGKGSTGSAASGKSPYVNYKGALYNTNDNQDKTALQSALGKGYDAYVKNNQVSQSTYKNADNLWKSLTQAQRDSTTTKTSYTNGVFSVTDDKGNAIGSANDKSYSEYPAKGLEERTTGDKTSYYLNGQQLPDETGKKWADDRTKAGDLSKWGYDSNTNTWSYGDRKGLTQGDANLYAEADASIKGKTGFTVSDFRYKDANGNEHLALQKKEKGKTVYYESDGKTPRTETYVSSLGGAGQATYTIDAKGQRTFKDATITTKDGTKTTISSEDAYKEFVSSYSKGDSIDTASDGTVTISNEDKGIKSQFRKTSTGENAVSSNFDDAGAHLKRTFGKDSERTETFETVYIIDGKPVDKKTYDDPKTEGTKGTDLRHTNDVEIKGPKGSKEEITTTYTIDPKTGKETGEYTANGVDQMTRAPLSYETGKKNPDGTIDEATLIKYDPKTGKYTVYDKKTVDNAESARLKTQAEGARGNADNLAGVAKIERDQANKAQQDYQNAKTAVDSANTNAEQARLKAEAAADEAERLRKEADAAQKALAEASVEEKDILKDAATAADEAAKQAATDAQQTEAAAKQAATDAQQTEANANVADKEAAATREDTEATKAEDKADGAKAEAEGLARDAQDAKTAETQKTGKLSDADQKALDDFQRDRRQYNTAEGFRLYSFFMTQFNVAGFISGLMMNEDDMEERREEIDKFFCDTIILGDVKCWVSKVCDKQYDKPVDGILYTIGPSGALMAAASVQGEVTKLTYPNETTGETIIEYLYKYTFHVKATTEDLKFDVKVSGPGGSKYLLEDKELDGDESGDGDGYYATNENAIVEYSRKLYTKICIEFDDGPENFEGEEVDKVCNKISAAAIPIYAKK